MATASSLVDLVAVQVNSGGSGPIILGAAAKASRGVEALSDNTVYSYSIQQGDEFELGQCSYMASGQTIIRTPKFSSNGGEPINVQSGAIVNFTALADDFKTIVPDLAGYVLASVLGQSSGSNGVGWIQSGVGAVFRFILNKLRDVVNVADFGAKGDGTSDDTAAIQAAINTGKRVVFNPGLYVVTNALTVTTPGQTIKGAGRCASMLRIPASFNLSAQGIFVCTAGEPGMILEDIGIVLIQPDTTVRANLIAYPPAIYAYSQPRSRMLRVRIEGARTAVDWRGNNGGSSMIDCEISNYDFTVRGDGSLDTMKIGHLQAWPFGLTANQQTIYYDGNNCGGDFGRVDGLTISDSTFIMKGRQLNFFAGFGGSSTFADITNTNFDSNPTIYVSAGSVSLSSCIIGAASSDVHPIQVVGGSDASLRITGSEFKVFVGMTSPVAELQATGGSPDLQITGCKFFVYGDATLAKASASGGSANMTIAGNMLFLPVGTTPTLPLFNADNGSRLIFVNNRATDKGAGAGTMLSVASDNSHIVRDNAFTGWNINLPAQWSTMNIGGNIAIAQGDFNGSGFVIGNVLRRRFTGTADSSGTVNITHGVPTGATKIMSAVGYGKGGAAEMRQLTFAYIDAANMQFTGAGANNPYRVTIEWTLTDQSW